MQSKVEIYVFTIMTTLIIHQGKYIIKQKINQISHVCLPRTSWFDFVTSGTGIDVSTNSLVPIFLKKQATSIASKIAYKYYSKVISRNLGQLRSSIIKNNS